MLNALEVGAWNDLVIRPRQCVGDVTAGSDIHGIVALKQAGDRHITYDASVVAHLDAKIIHIFVALFIGDAARQTPDGNAIDHDTASKGIGFVDCYRLSHFTYIARPGEAWRS